jgi:pimeloyl-ACP methyl ester carboxylesterase
MVCLSGVGGSPREWEAIAPALAAFGAVVTAVPPRGALVVVGHSQGGVEALRLASGQPDRVGAVILTSSFFPPARAGRSLAETALDYAHHRLLYLRERARGGRAPRPTRRGLRQMAVVARFGVRPHAYHRLAQAVRCPVLVIHGERDHVVPVAFARAAVAAHPDWAYRELAGAGHRPHRDRAQAWAGVATAWLEDVLAGSEPPHA